MARISKIKATQKMLISLPNYENVSFEFGAEVIINEDDDLDVETKKLKDFIGNNIMSDIEDFISTNDINSENTK